MGLVSLASVFFIGGVAHAQTLPGSVDPSRAQQRLRESQPTQPKPDISLPDTRVSTPTPPPQPAEGFVLKSLIIEGNTVFSDEELLATYKEQLGLLADLSTLQYIAGRITQLYRDEGYLISSSVVPAQNIKNGVAKIAVIEGYISQVHLDGDMQGWVEAHDNLGMIEKVKRTITSMRPLHGPALERQLLLLNGTSGISVHAILEPLPPENAVPGAVGMIIKIEINPYDFNLSFDNFGSRFAGPFQLTAGAGINNALVAFDRASASVLTTTQTKEVRLAAASYALPVTSNGGALEIRSAYSTLEPGHTLKEFDVQSKSYNAGLRYQQNIVRSRRQNLNISAGLDYANITTDFLGSNLYKDRIRALRLGINYDNVDRWSGTNSVVFTLSQGLDILGVRKTGSENLSRATGHSDFTKINANMARVQQVGSSFQLFGAVSGQYSWDPLLSSEEFGYGGQSFGRAYDPSEITGDHGITASTELRYNGLPEWNKTLMEPFLFYDIGKVWKPDADNASQILSAASAGIGIKFLYNQKINGYFVIAHPLTKPASAPLGYTDDQGPKLLFQLSTQF